MLVHPRLPPGNTTQWNARKKLSRIARDGPSERSYEVELPQGVLRRNRIHLGKTNKPPTMINVIQPEQCNEPQPQKPAEPVTETNGLPSQSAVEVPTEVPPTVPATPEKAPAPRRSPRVRRAPRSLEDYVST